MALPKPLITGLVLYSMIIPYLYSWSSRFIRSKMRHAFLPLQPLVVIVGVGVVNPDIVYQCLTVWHPGLSRGGVSENRFQREMPEGVLPSASLFSPGEQSLFFRSRPAGGRMPVSIQFRTFQSRKPPLMAERRMLRSPAKPAWNRLVVF